METEGKERMRRILKFITAFAIITGSSMPIMAEETEVEKMPVIPEGATGSLTLRYFDDSDETAPIPGAVFEIIQVADIGRGVDTNGAYIPLAEGLEFTDDAVAEDYEAKVLEAYEANPELGYTAEGTIGEDGTFTFTEVPAGAYLVRNTETVRYHITSIPFLVSVPETNETQDSWNFDVTAYPKPNLAGDLSIRKTLSGDEASDTDVFSFEITISDAGSYKAVLPGGTEGTVKNGDVISIKGGQSIVIYDLPEHSDYKVVELEANQNGYRTLYKNSEGKITYAEKADAEVINNKEGVKTGVSTDDIALGLSVIGGGLAVLILLLYLHRKSKREQKENDETNA